MAILYLGGGYGTTSSTVPSHAAGDVIVICAMNTGAAITMPAGWTELDYRNNNSAVRVRIGYKVAASSGEVSGTWTGASEVHCRAFRTEGAVTTATCNSVSATGNPNPSTFPDLTVDAPDVVYIRVAAGNGPMSAPSGWLAPLAIFNGPISAYAMGPGPASTLGGNTSSSGSANSRILATVGIGAKSASSGFFQFF